MPVELHSPQNAWHPLSTWSGITISLPFLGETVLDAHQIGHSGLSWNVSDVSFPDLIRTMRIEEIPLLFLPLCLDARRFRLLHLRTILTLLQFVLIPWFISTAHILIYLYVVVSLTQLYDPFLDWRNNLLNIPHFEFVLIFGLIYYGCPWGIP
jgi:hypothetical protein